MKEHTKTILYIEGIFYKIHFEDNKVSVLAPQAPGYSAVPNRNIHSSPSIIASSSHQVQSIKPLDLVVKPPVFASPAPGPPDCSKTHWQTQDGLAQVP